MNIRNWLFLGILGAFAYGCSSDTPSGKEDNGKEKEEEKIPDNLETYHYELPVIFHVLYKDKNDKTQYLSASRLKEIIEKVNKVYANTNGSVDMNLEFKLATTDENGKELATPGVEYVAWPETYPIDCMEFMSNDENKYTKYIWEPTKYINIMMYNFESEDGETTTLGISQFPYTPEGEHHLVGTLNGVRDNVSYTKAQLMYAYCVSINSLFINEESTATAYNQNDIVATLTHELGHFLGLRHVFSEKDVEVEEENADGTTSKGTTTDTDSCEDTDYCEDTPSYNKTEYDNYTDYVFTNFYKSAADGKKVYNMLITRKSCTGEEFTSTNVMDYAFSKNDAFTPNQRDRVRQVLMYAALMPGYKYKVSSRTGEVPTGKVKLPIRPMR